MKKTLILLLLLGSVISSFSQMRFFYGPLAGANEVPPNASTANGMVVARYNLATRFFELFGNYNGLSSNITGSHIHIAAPGVNGSILITLPNTGGSTGTISGNGILSVAQEAELLAGNFYANVHSTTFPGGEIRSQLFPTTTGQTEFVNARLQGAQEVPPNNSTASGWANVLVDKTTNKAYLTGSFTGLTAAATAAHIHIAAPGSNGSIVLTLINTNATGGTLHGEGTLTAPQITSIATGGSYVNVHNSIFPGGEIRGQLTNFSQQQFFGGRLSGANENPPNASAATGTVIAKYTMATRELELTGDYQGLTTTISGSHIHVGSPSINGPVIITLTNTGGTFGTLTGSGTLTVEQEDSLLNNKLYVNVHSTTFTGGEIRTQLLMSASGETQYFKANLSGAQEVPANASTATGSVTVIANKVTGQTYVTGSFAGLTNNISGSHIHREQTGVNGPIIMSLSNTGTTAGNFSGSQVLSAPQIDSLINGFTYVNLHSTPNFAGGEIRAQLGNLVLPVKLAFFNGYKENQQVILKWETVTEQNAKQYEIEQQNTTNNTWLKKSAILATGRSSGSKYEAVDVPLTYDQPYVYYRLKMIDKDGSFAYSPVVKINFNKAALAVSIANNPVKNVLNYWLSGFNNNSKATVNIIDQNGRTLHREVVGVTANHTINIEQLTAGIYTLVVQVGDERIEKRFIKQ